MSIWKKIWGVTSTVLVVLTVLCAVFLMGSRLIGYEVYTVISGSMRPTYQVYDLLYVKPLTDAEKSSIDASGIEVGDVITFLKNEEGAIGTHRVTEIDEENMLLYTKGDANSAGDINPTHLKNVVGEPAFSLPLLGFIATYIQTPPWSYITIAVLAVLIVLVFLPDLLHKKEKPQEAAE